MFPFKQPTLFTFIKQWPGFTPKPITNKVSKNGSQHDQQDDGYVWPSKTCGSILWQTNKFICYFIEKNACSKQKRISWKKESNKQTCFCKHNQEQNIQASVVNDPVNKALQKT